MKELNLEKCESLADVFCALIGGRPDDVDEIKNFMIKSPLRQLIHIADMDRIINYDGFFSDEVVDAIYALLPPKLKIAPNRTWIMTPQAFRKLNAAQLNKPACRFINVSMQKAMHIYMVNYENKIKRVINAINGIEDEPEKEEIKAQPVEQSALEKKRARNRLNDQKRRRKELKKQKTADSKKTSAASAKKTTLTEEKPVIITVKAEPQEVTKKQIPSKIRKIKDPQKWAKVAARLGQIKKLYASTTSKKKRKELKKEISRLQAAKYRLENPGAWKKNYKKISELPPEKQAKRRAGNRRRNDTFRDIHREELRVYHNNRRAQEKAENPEAVKEKDKKHNSSAEAKAAKKRYYEKNAKQVIERAVRHNKIKRFKQKTGPVILGLLQGIINSKIK